MEESRPENDGQEAPKRDPQRLTYVMLVVLILCGGNGASIIAAALLWKRTGQTAAAILTVVGVTAVAFLAAMVLIRSHNKKLK